MYPYAAARAELLRDVRWIPEFGLKAHRAVAPGAAHSDSSPESSEAAESYIMRVHGTGPVDSDKYPISAPRTCSFGDGSEKRSRVDGIRLRGRYRGYGLRAHSTVWPQGVAVVPIVEAGTPAATRITASHHTGYVTSSRSVPTMIRIMASASSHAVGMARYTCSVQLVGLHRLYD